MAYAGAAHATFPGHPYSGAVERLIRIHREAREPLLRAHTLYMLPIVQGRERALPYLREVAASKDPTAAFAVFSLMGDARGGLSGIGRTTVAERQESRAILSELLRRELIADPTVARNVTHFLKSPPR